MSKRNPRQPRRRRVTFSFSIPEGRDVSLVGDFNGWSPKKHPMNLDGNGCWTKTLMLAPGTYEYKLWIDGTWRVDRQNPDVCANCHGTLNNRITVHPKGDAAER